MFGPGASHVAIGLNNTSLLGTAEASKFTDPLRVDVEKPLFERQIHGPGQTGESRTTIRYTVLIIVISALLFVTIVATYDVVRLSITNYYARTFLTDQTIIDNSKTALISSGFFAVFCWVSILIFVPILTFWLRHQVKYNLKKAKSYLTAVEKT